MNIEIQSNLLKHILKNVYFINGTAYAGKSTMVRLLAEKHNGIHCGENYHDALTAAIDAQHQPNMSYFDTMSGWPEFLNRAPEQYAAWIEGVSREAAQMELLLLTQLAAQGKKIFVDTNIDAQTLHAVSDYHRVAIMLSPQSTSVERFFDRSDPEKQFLLRQIDNCEDPAATLANFRACLQRINSEEVYHFFENSGFFVLKRDDSRTLEQTLRILEEHFGLL